MLQRFRTTLKDALFPLQCIECQRDGALWCPACRAGFELRKKQMCPGCNKVTVYGACCAKHPDHPLDGVIAATWYANQVPKSLVRLWKYQYIRAAEPEIEWLLARWSNQQLLPAGNWEIVPVPLHPRKQRERGFDQAQILTGMFSQELGLPIQSCLERARYGGKAQAKVPSAIRGDRDFSGVFRVSGEVPEDVLLVDDVYTTGVTMSGAAMVLKGAGVRRVWGCVFARG